MLDSFAQDLQDVEKHKMLATQGPPHTKIFEDRVPVVAWKTKPTWYVIATKDLAIPANVQTMMATRMKAQTVRGHKSRGYAGEAGRGGGAHPTRDGLTEAPRLCGGPGAGVSAAPPSALRGRRVSSRSPW
jgi:hypothetical protein